MPLSALNFPAASPEMVVFEDIRHILQSMEEPCLSPRQLAVAFQDLLAQEAAASEPLDYQRHFVQTLWNRLIDDVATPEQMNQVYESLASLPDTVPDCLMDRVLDRWRMLLSRQVAYSNN